jgi:hypothetical protein
VENRFIKKPIIAKTTGNANDDWVAWLIEKKSNSISHPCLRSNDSPMKEAAAKHPYDFTFSNRKIHKTSLGDGESYKSIDFEIALGLTPRDDDENRFVTSDTSMISK